MSSIRKKIRQKVVERLLEVNTSAETRVYNSRRDLLQEGQDSFPLIVVYTPSESNVQARNTEYRKSVTISIEANISSVAGDDFDDKMDDLADQIEQAFFNYEMTSQITELVDFEYNETSFDVVTDKSTSQLYGSVIVSYIGKYSTVRKR